ncbi:Replication initiator protein A [Terriglobus roseus DSM 18391]|uniref:Replication initiator protein A n=1 Tax=Terriglobus roseus (strain DSM 18391 / NRRL B-41598 / KBS 63) TaxID=926566 RepID=I3ZJC7_TERRK|nr:replication initiator protein A [Terriglobus roseus]AFL89345.1 Replication initiator protein A [Terriglobus roseus DSM 18391]
MAKRPEANQKTIALPDAIDLIRFEKNLLQIGFFSAHDRRSNDPDLSRRIEQWVNRDGKRIRVSAEFRSTLGLPSTSDRDKYMAFMKIAMERKMMEGEITNPIRFSGYSMLKALGLSDSGANYEDLNQWGMRMADTTITSEQIIYSSSRRKFMNKTVHVFRSFTRTGESDNDGGNQTVQFAVELEDWLLENLNQSYVVPEDFTQYRKLVRPTAKGIFVYLYVWFYASRGKEVEKDYGELCALLNVRCYQHVSKIRETMGLSLDDLVGIGYLQKWDIRSMSSKKGFKLVLSPGRAILDVIATAQRRQLVSTANHTELVGAQSELSDALVSRGVAEDKAAAICRAHDPDVVKDQLEYLDSEIARDGGRRIKNPAGFIIAFIDGGKGVPLTFETTRKRDERRSLLTEQLASHEEQIGREIQELTLRERYESWRRTQADEVIERAYGQIDLDKKLRQIRVEVSKDRRIGIVLDRLTAEQCRRDLLRLLQKEIADELQLPTFDEWLRDNGQGVLFGD